MTVWGSAVNLKAMSFGAITLSCFPRTSVIPRRYHCLGVKGCAPEGSDFLSSVTGPAGFVPSLHRHWALLLITPAVETLPDHRHCLLYTWAYLSKSRLKQTIICILLLHG